MQEFKTKAQSAPNFHLYSSEASQESSWTIECNECHLATGRFRLGKSLAVCMTRNNRVIFIHESFFVCYIDQSILFWARAIIATGFSSSLLFPPLVRRWNFPGGEFVALLQDSTRPTSLSVLDLLQSGELSVAHNRRLYEILRELYRSEVPSARQSANINIVSRRLYQCCSTFSSFRRLNLREDWGNRAGSMKDQHADLDPSPRRLSPKVAPLRFRQDS